MYMEKMNEMFHEFENTGAKMFHINPGTADDHEKWMARTGSMYDHLSDTDQKVSRRYGMIITHPEHPKVAGFTNRGFVLVDKEMDILYLWRAERPIHTVDMNSLLIDLRKALERTL
jgi:peroxiredoxin